MHYLRVSRGGDTEDEGFVVGQDEIQVVEFAGGNGGDLDVICGVWTVVGKDGF